MYKYSIPHRLKHSGIIDYLASMYIVIIFTTGTRNADQHPEQKRLRFAFLVISVSTGHKSPPTLVEDSSSLNSGGQRGPVQE